LKNENIQLNLYLRNADRLENLKSDRVSLIEGDVLDAGKMKEAMKGQEIVYINLDGPLDKMVKNILDAMKANDVNRIILITSLGIYNEIPGAFGKWHDQVVGKYMGPYRKAADMVEDSGFDYTILRPTWLTNQDEIDYELSEKGDSSSGTEVSRKSVAAFVVKLIETDGLYIGKSLGLVKPNTVADKPSWY
jgi:uncharacterized protein YbjT (DUF2867 family)